MPLVTIKNSRKLNRIFFILRWITFPFNIIAIGCFTLFLYKFFSRKSKYDCFTLLSVFRSIVHIPSALLSFSIIIFGETLIPDKTTFSIIIYVKSLIPLYFILTEFVIGFNRYIAISYYIYYDVLFPKKVIYIIQAVVVFFTVTITFSADLVDTQGEFVSFVTTGVGGITLLFNIATFVRIVHMQISGSKSANFSNCVKTFTFSIFQLFLSFALFAQAWVEIKDNFNLIIFFTIGDSMKDGLEGLATVYFFRKFIFRRRGNRITTITNIS